MAGLYIVLKNIFTEAGGIYIAFYFEILIEICEVHWTHVHSGTEVPCGYTVQAIHGFVEELDVNDDPEYQVRTEFTGHALE